MVKIDELKQGVRVEYHPIGTAQNTSTGQVMDVLTEKQPAGDTGVQVNASENEPRVLIRNDHTSKETAYKLENIVKILD
jgi:hypothetical protein